MMVTKKQLPFLLQEDHKSTLFEKLKRNKGWTKAYLESINNNEHKTLKDMDLMVDTLKSIHDSQEVITVLPDFDMDGVCSGITLWAGLAELGFNVELYTPDYKLGHDIGPNTIDDLVSKHPQTKAIITCDGGINSHQGMQHGKDLGLTMLITDHHTQEQNFSPADVVVDPMRLDEEYDLGGICGAHVAWQVLENYAKKYQPHKTRDIALLRVFVGIGTVSDVMPLLNENRAAVKDAIGILRGLYVPLPPEDSATEYKIDNSVLLSIIKTGNHAPQFISAFEGLAVTLQTFREYGKLETYFDDNGNPILDENGEVKTKRHHGKLRRSQDINEEFFGFYLAPAFNSIRRIEGDMENAFGVFTENTVEKKLQRAQAIVDSNEERKVLVEEYLQEIEQIDQPWAPWVYLTTAPGGMKGLIAAKIMHNTKMPVAVINTTDDPSAERSGSARAPEWFDVIANMNSDTYRAVGHPGACGVFMNDEKAVAQFTAHMELVVQELLVQIEESGIDATGGDLTLGDSEDTDGTLDNIDEILELASRIATLQPFGREFPNPVFELVLDLNKCRIDTLGSEGTHLKILTSSGIKVLGWNMADLVEPLLQKITTNDPQDMYLRVIATLSINEFQGHISPQFTINEVIS